MEVLNGFNLYVCLEGIFNDSILFSCYMDMVKLGIGIEFVIEDGIICFKGNMILGGDDKFGIVVIFEVVCVLCDS